MWIDLSHDISLCCLDQALVKVDLAGICSTDLEIRTGYKVEFVGVLGHEIVGTVVETKKQHLLHQRVCIEINAVCNDCSHCAEGSVWRRNHCLGRSVLGIWNSSQGAFSEYICVPTSNLIVLPDRAVLPDDVAVFLEPLAAAYRIVEQLEAKSIPFPGSSTASNQHTCNIAVVGDGKLGLLIALVLCLRFTEDTSEYTKLFDACTVTLIGKHEWKLGILKDAGLTLKTILLNCVEESISELRNKYDLVVAATGSSSGFQLVTDLCKQMGTVVLKTTCSSIQRNDTNKLEDPSLVAAMNQVVVKELTMVGSRCGPMQQALDFLLDERHRDRVMSVLQKMKTSSFALENIAEAFTYIATEKPLKVLITP